MKPLERQLRNGRSRNLEFVESYREAARRVNRRRDRYPAIGLPIRALLQIQGFGFA